MLSYLRRVSQSLGACQIIGGECTGGAVLWLPFLFIAMLTRPLMEEQISRCSEIVLKNSFLSLKITFTICQERSSDGCLGTSKLNVLMQSQEKMIATPVFLKVRGEKYNKQTNKNNTVILKKQSGKPICFFPCTANLRFLGKCQTSSNILSDVIRHSKRSTTKTLYS